MIYPDGETLTSQYDANGFLRSAYFGTSNTTNPVNFLIGQISYTNNGQVSNLAFGGSGAKGSVPTPVFTTATTYDGIQRPLSTNTSVAGHTIWSQTATYDNVGNVLGLSTTVPTQSGGSATDNESFCYDALNRMVWAGNNGTPTGGDHCMSMPSTNGVTSYTQVYGYDNLDRLTNGPVGNYTYGDSNHVHALTFIGRASNQYATYDAMGNMTCRNVDATTGHTCAGSIPTGAQFTYDVEGRLSAWTAPTGTSASEHMLYDNAGRLVLNRTTTSQGNTSTVYFGLTETVLTSSMTVTTKYYTINGQRVAERVGGTLSYLISNLQGSPTLALNNTGNVSAVQLYLPYGTPSFAWGTMPTAHGYTDQLLDSQMGLMYYGARYYDPVTARFVSADIVQSNTSGLDPYSYVFGNPETLTDPTGHDVCGDDPAACDSNATPEEVQGSQGAYRPSASGAGGANESVGGNPTNGFVVPTIEGTLADGSRYLYTPDDGSILVETPDGDLKLLEPGDNGYDQVLQELDQSDVSSSAAETETRGKERMADAGTEGNSGSGNGTTTTSGSGTSGDGGTSSVRTAGPGGTDAPSSGNSSPNTVNLNPNVK